MNRRSRHSPPFIRAVQCVVLGALATAAGAEVSLLHPERCLLTRKDAFMLDIPEVVAQGPVSEARWSPSGAHVLALRVKPDVRESLAGRPVTTTALVLWKGEGGRSLEVWKSGKANPHPIQLAWLANTEVALALVPHSPPDPRRIAEAQTPQLTERWLLRIDARRSSARLLFRVPEDTRLNASPTYPIAFLSSLEKNTLRLIGASGAVREFGSPRAGEQIVNIFWADDGSRLGFATRDRNATDVGRSRPSWHLLDAASGRITPTPTRPRHVAQQPTAVPPLHLRTGAVTLREGGTERELQPLWLEATEVSEQPRVLVAADSPGGFLSPRDDAVLYTSEGTAYVRRLVRIERKQYLLAKAEAERKSVMSNLKQLGIALLIYVQDHQGTFPSADADMSSLLATYLKPGTPLEGFTYVFPGGNLADISEPSKTLLGYAPAPGGRVHLYVDGHVRYEPLP